MYPSRSPLDMYSSTMYDWKKEVGLMNDSALPSHSATRPVLSHTDCKLTGSSTVTTPCNEITLVCQNWPMIAASCKNNTLSFSEATSLSLLTATCTHSSSHDHKPLKILAKFPDPICSKNLWERNILKLHLLFIKCPCFCLALFDLLVSHGIF